jgi:hypothetical protein
MKSKTNDEILQKLIEMRSVWANKLFEYIISDPK